MEDQKTTPADWRSAEEAYAAQPDVLRGYPRHLAAQLESLPTVPRRVLLVGIGASYAATSAGATVMRAQGLDATRHLPAEVPDVVGEDAVAILASQSGRSAEVLAVGSSLDQARVVSLTNFKPSPLQEIAALDLNLGNHADSRVSFLSFTGTMLGLGMIADQWAGNLDIDAWEDRIDSALAVAAAARPAVEEAARVLSATPSIDVTVCAPLLATAEETALMLREAPRIPATAMETRTYLHGPMEVGGAAGHLVIGAEREARMVEQLSARSDAIFFISTDPGLKTPKGATVTAVLGLLTDDPITANIAATLMGQYLVQRLCQEVGVGIDDFLFQQTDTKIDPIPA